MSREHVMKRNFLMIVCFVCAVFPVRAEIVCNEDFLGYKKCSGTNELGELLQTESYKDMSGTVYTSGRIGIEEVSLKTEFNPLGEAETSGRIGSYDVGADMSFNRSYGNGVRRVPPEVYTNIDRVRNDICSETASAESPLVPTSVPTRSPVLKKHVSGLSKETAVEDVYTPNLQYDAPVIVRERRERPTRVYIYERRSVQDENEYIRRPRY